jgi:hypothetical protein
VRNPIYQLAALRKYARSIGWPAALLLRYRDFKDRVGMAGPQTRELRLKNSAFPILMRTQTSDRDVLGQVFIQQEYGRIELSKPRMILDLGANVGYSSAYFLSKYPETRVLAVEPDPSNYEVCRRNLAPFGREPKSCTGQLGRSAPNWCSKKASTLTAATGRPRSRLRRKPRRVRRMSKLTI